MFKKRFIILSFLCLCLAFTVPHSTLQVHAGVQDNLVQYNPGAIVKGNYWSPIWEQHTIWPKNSGAGRHGCGIVSTAIALRLNGVDIDPNVVLAENGRTVAKCKAFRGSDAAAYIRSKGVNAFNFNSKSYSKKTCISIMNNALQNGKIVMVMVRGVPFSGQNHWIVLTGFTSTGKVVVANTSYGGRKVCKITGKQYQIVSWSQIKKKMVYDSPKWSRFIVIGNDTVTQ